MTETERLKEMLFNNKKNGWENVTEERKEEISRFGDEYIHYLNTCKTERESVDFSKEILEKNGFTFISSQRVAMSPLHVAVEYLCRPAKPLRVSRNTRLSLSTPRCPLYIASAFMYA